MPTSQKQRQMMKELAWWLDGDLFKRDKCDDDVNPDTSGQWRSPLGWSVILSPRQDGAGFSGAVRNPAGETISQTSFVDIPWLEEKLP